LRAVLPTADIQQLKKMLVTLAIHERSSERCRAGTDKQQHTNGPHFLNQLMYGEVGKSFFFLLAANARLTVKNDAERRRLGEPLPR
jgi:hypothetical protein